MSDGIMKKLPQDVTSCIILRLAVKSLLRYKCISKTWCTLLESSYFINLHVKRPTTTKEELILLKRSFEEGPNQYKNVLSFLSGCDDDHYPISPNIDVPNLSTTFGSVTQHIMGPYNGLIVLSDNEHVVLLNPSTRKYNLLQPSPFEICPPGFDRYICGLGFGIDLRMNDYKFVRINEISSDLYKDPCVRGNKVEVYELNIEAWREEYYEEETLPSVYWSPCSELFYKGVCHWFASGDGEVILCFDMSTDTFRNIKMPHTCFFPNGMCYGLVILNDSLTLICYRDPTCEIDPLTDVIDIWTMKDYGVNDSWIMGCTIRPLPIESPLTIWNDLLLLQSKSGQLISYNFISDEVKEYNLHGYPGSLRVIVYKESLTSTLQENSQGTQAQGF